MSETNLKTEQKTVSKNSNKPVKFWVYKYTSKSSGEW